jgi:hypothetical protein
MEHDSSSDRFSCSDIFCDSGMDHARKAVAAATALQGAARILIHGGEPKAHECLPLPKKSQKESHEKSLV